MLREEFDRIMEIFAQSAQGKTINLESLFAESMEFFGKLKVVLQTGTPEEKKEAVGLMGEMYTKMMGEVKRISERTGLSEEQLMTIAENPANFSQDQWRLIQEAKSKVSQTGADLARILAAPSKAEGSPPSSAPSQEGVKRKGSSKMKKGNWMRS